MAGFFCCLVLASGGLEARPRPATQNQRLSPWLVDVDWLKARLDDETVVIVDTRNEDAYSRGHLPGAVLLDLSDLDVKTSATGLDLLNEELARRFSRLGLAGGEAVVFYDEATGVRAPRALWLFVYAGQVQAKVLQGGMAAWTQAGLPTSTAPRLREVRPFSVRNDPDIMASADYVAKRIRNVGSIIVDVRSRVEYQGREAQRHCARSGRIPGATWLEWTELLGPNRFAFLELGQLQTRLSEAGVGPEKEIIIYCHRGYRAANTYLALRLLGYPRVKYYAGSWHEWAARLDLPAERVEPTGSIRP